MKTTLACKQCDFVAISELGMDEHVTNCLDDDELSLNISNEETVFFCEFCDFKSCMEEDIQTSCN